MLSPNRSTRRPFHPRMALPRTAGVAKWMIDFGDLSTMYADSAGTTPAAIEGTLGKILDKSGAGNHFVQTDAAKRLKVSARVNMLTKTEDFADAAWVKYVDATIVSDAVQGPAAVGVADAVVASSAIHNGIYQTVAVAADVQCVFSFIAKSNGKDWLHVNNMNGHSGIWFNLSTGTQGTARAGVTGTITLISDSWYSIKVTCASVATSYCEVGATDADNSAVCTGNGSAGFYITKADFRPANSGAKLPVYQRVNTATDYDTVGFPVYLKQNATNTAFLVSAATIDCSGTDAMTVFWGGRKLSDAALGTVYASSATPASTNGAFRLSAPGANGENTYLVTSRGTSLTDALASSRVAPLSNVVTMTSDISGDFIKLRVNGALIDTDTGDQGTGNYANESMYIGMRGSTLLPFTGHLHSLIGCGALLSDYAMRKIEDWQAGQMRITL